jgi:type II secretory pathway component PulM
MSTGAQYVVAAYGVVLFGLVMYLVAVGARSARLQREAELLARLVERQAGVSDAEPERSPQAARTRPDPRPLEAP